MNQHVAGRFSSGPFGFLKSARMDECSFALSGTAALAIVALAVAETLGQSIFATPTARYTILALLLLGIQAASAGLALGVASLLRSTRSTQAWLGVALGTAVLIFEIVLFFHALRNNY